MYYISVIKSDELYYLENMEALYDDPSYYADETQDAIEDCDIVNIIEDLKWTIANYNINLKFSIESEYDALKNIYI